MFCLASTRALEVVPSDDTCLARRVGLRHVSPREPRCSDGARARHLRLLCPLGTKPLIGTPTLVCSSRTASTIRGESVMRSRRARCAIPSRVVECHRNPTWKFWQPGLELSPAPKRALCAGARQPCLERVGASPCVFISLPSAVAILGPACCLAPVGGRLPPRESHLRRPKRPHGPRGPAEPQRVRRVVQRRRWAAAPAASSGANPSPHGVRCSGAGPRREWRFLLAPAGGNAALLAAVPAA